MFTTRIFDNLHLTDNAVDLAVDNLFLDIALDPELITLSESLTISTTNDPPQHQIIDFGALGSPVVFPSTDVFLQQSSTTEVGGVRYANLFGGYVNDNPSPGSYYAIGYALTNGGAFQYLNGVDGPKIHLDNRDYAVTSGWVDVDPVAYNANEVYLGLIKGGGDDMENGGVGKITLQLSNVQP